MRVRYACISKKVRGECLAHGWLSKLRMPRSRASQGGGQPPKKEWLREAGGRKKWLWLAGCACNRPNEQTAACLHSSTSRPGRAWGCAACWSAVRPTRATHIRTKAAATAFALLAFMIAPFMMQARNYLGPPLHRLMRWRGPRVYGCSWCSHLQMLLVRTMSLAIHPYTPATKKVRRCSS